MRHAAAVVLWSLAAQLLLAGPAGAKFRGGTPGAWLGWGAGGRALAMGKAFVGVADDASATFWLPAGLSQLDRKELTLLNATLWAGTQYQFLSFAKPRATLGTWGLNLVRMSASGFEEVDSSNVATGRMLSDSRMALTYAVGREVAESVSAGLALRYASHNAFTVSSTLITLEPSVMLTKVANVPGLRAGFVLRNLIRRQSGLTDDRIPVALRAGASYKMLKDKVLVALDLEKGGQANLGYHLGAEYWLLNFAALRFGVDGAAGEGVRETDAGFGVRIKSFKIDFAFGANAIGVSNRVALSWVFGKSTQGRKESESRNFYREGIEAYRQGAYLLAVKKLGQALDIDPKNKEVQEMLQRLQVVTGAIALAIEDNPGAALIRKGVSTYVEGDLRTAVNVLQAAYSEQPSNDKLRDLLRRIAQEAGVTVEVKPTGVPAQGVPTGMTFTERKLYQALDYFYKGQYDLVIQECNDVLAIEPNNTVALQRLGSAFYMGGLKEKAREAWQRVLALEPNNPQIQEMLRSVTP